MNEEILNRKGGRKAQDIPKKVLELLNDGKIESVNLTEWLAIDHLKLVNASFSKIGISKEKIKLISENIKNQKNLLR